MLDMDNYNTSSEEEMIFQVAELYCLMFQKSDERSIINNYKNLLKKKLSKTNAAQQIDLFQQELQKKVVDAFHFHDV
jgi:hypothetical protein